METLREEIPTPDPILHPKPDTPRRVLAYLIDGIGAAIVGGLVPFVGGLVAAAYMIVRDGLDVEFMDRRSIGKRLMKLRPVRLDGSPMDLEASVRRNWMFGISGIAQATFQFGLGEFVALAAGLIGLYEIYRVLTDPNGRRWGDELAGTQVVDAGA